MQTQIFGHRGWRGAYPENSLIACQKALDLSISGIEIDVVVNASRRLVVSHDTFFNRSFCLNPERKKLSVREQKKSNLFLLDQEEIEKYDCGGLTPFFFKKQQNYPSKKMLFTELITKIDLNSKMLLLELKSEEKDYGKRYPFPNEYASIVKKELENLPNLNIVLMSFDANLLNALYEIDRPKIFLHHKPYLNIVNLLDNLTFTPYGLGMYHRLLRKKDIFQLHQIGIKCFAWTVNLPKNASKLKDWQIDGIISDYPDLM